MLIPNSYTHTNIRNSVDYVMLLKGTGASACYLMVGHVNWLSRTFCNVRATRLIVAIMGRDLFNSYLKFFLKRLNNEQKS